MDRDIPETVKAGRKNKGLLLIGSAIGILVLLTVLLRTGLRTSLKKSSLSVAVVERGEIENTLNATGEVFPEFEEVITSPINASIMNVSLDAGTEVRAGQSILTLDKTASVIRGEKLKFQLESKRNSIRKLKLELDKSYYDIQSNNNIKQLRINSLEASVENTKRLFNAGGGTREDIEQAELNLKVALLEKQQLENEIKSKQQTMQLEMRESELEAQIQQSDLSDLERKLRLANIVASRPGIVTNRYFHHPANCFCTPPLFLGTNAGYRIAQPRVLCNTTGRLPGNRVIRWNRRPGFHQITDQYRA